VILLFPDARYIGEVGPLPVEPALFHDRSAEIDPADRFVAGFTLATDPTHFGGVFGAQVISAGVESCTP
jgi:hypothetical protein